MRVERQDEFILIGIAVSEEGGRVFHGGHGCRRGVVVVSPLNVDFLQNDERFFLSFLIVGLTAHGAPSKTNQDRILLKWLGRLHRKEGED